MPAMVFSFSGAAGLMLRAATVSCMDCCLSPLCFLRLGVFLDLQGAFLSLSVGQDPGRVLLWTYDQRKSHEIWLKFP